MRYYGRNGLYAKNSERLSHDVGLLLALRRRIRFIRQGKEISVFGRNVAGGLSRNSFHVRRRGGAVEQERQKNGSVYHTHRNDNVMLPMIAVMGIFSNDIKVDTSEIAGIIQEREKIEAERHAEI